VGCTVGVHQNKKVEIVHLHVYTNAGRNSAYTHPHVPLSVFGSTFNALLSELHPQEDWLRIFQGSALKILGADESFLPIKCCMAILDGINREAPGVRTCSKIMGGQTVEPKLSLVDAMLAQWYQEEAEAKRMQAATKVDDAEVPVTLWDQRILPNMLQAERGPILNVIRNFCLQWWERNVLRDFLALFQRTPDCLVAHQFKLRQVWRNLEAQQDLECGRDCVKRCANSTWWDWDAGSRPRHWRRPEEYRTVIRDGLKPWLISQPAEVTIPQRGEPDPGNKFSRNLPKFGTKDTWRRDVLKL
jgi:hypothetical protein